MSDCTVESQQQPSFAAPRRASDPVRTLDRNFGVGGQLASQARHGSYNQLNKQRLPLSGVMADGARNQSQYGSPAHQYMAPHGGSFGMQQHQSPYNQQQHSNPMAYPYQQQGSWPQQPGFQETQQQQQQQPQQSGFGYHHQPYQQQYEGSYSNQWQQQQQHWQQQQQWNNYAQVGDPNYQRTLEYVQQCQSWNNSGGIGGAGQPNNGQ